MPKKQSVSIRARVLGDASIVTARSTIEPHAEMLFGAALYLVLERKKPVNRRTLERVLWPEESARVAAHRLRQTLLKLKQLGIPVEVLGKETIGLNGTPVSVDFEEILSARKGVESDSNDALVMLPGYEPRFSQTYLEWLDTQKAEINASLTRMMLGIIARHRVKGEWVQVERNAIRLLRFQPYNEEATLALAEAHAMRGAKIDAIAILDKYLSEVGTGPTDLRVPATVMRRRIADRIHPRVETIGGQSPMVGRSREMEQLAELLARVREKSGQACLVWGEAGVGKTRLLSELSTFASLQGIPTHRVQCTPSDKYRPLSVFVDLVPTLRSMRGAIGCSPESFQYLDRLTKRALEEETIGRTTDDIEYTYSRVQQAIFDLVDAVSDETCTILLIEDVHWLDPSSAALLRDMIAWARNRSLFFAFTGRDPAKSVFVKSDGLHELRLLPLDAAASRDVILAISRQHGFEVAEDYVDWCVNVAEGNPYFLQELANQYIDRGDPHGVPSSLAAVLNDRIARLSDDALLVLQTASVLERNSTFDLIERTLNFEAHRMLRAVDELGVAGMLLIEAGDRTGSEENRITSRHDLLSNAALSKLTAPARAFLHRRVGTVIEQDIDEGRSASALWDCAKHWQLAGDIARAFRLAKYCATHAMDVGLPTAAAEAYERALNFCRDPHDRLSVLSDLTTAYYRSEAWADVRRVLPQVRELQLQLKPAAPMHDELELMGIRADWRYNVNDIPISRALAFLEDQTASDDHRFRAGGLALMMLDGHSRQDEMHPVYATIERLSERAGTNSPAYLEAAMVYHTICGSLPTAADAARRFLSQERQRGNQGEISRDLLNVARVLRTAGYPDEAYSLMREGEARAAEYRLPHAARYDLPALAAWEMEKGDVAAAEAWYEKLVSVSHGDKTPYERRDLAVVGTRIALCRSNPRLARRRFATTLQEILRTKTGQLRTYELAVCVAIDLLEYRISQRALQALEESYLSSRRNCAQGFAVVVLCEALKHCKQGKRSEEILHEYVNHFRREVSPLGPGTARFFEERLDRRRTVVIRA